MAKVDVSIELNFTESFDFEDLKAAVASALGDAISRGELDLQGGDNSSTPGCIIECLTVGHVCAVWRD
jgi:hypothetical protein